MIVKRFLFLVLLFTSGCTRITYPVRMNIGIANLTTDTVTIITRPFVNYNGGPEKAIMPRQVNEQLIYEWVYPSMSINAQVLKHDSEQLASDTTVDKKGVYLMRPASAIEISSVDRLFFFIHGDTTRLLGKDVIFKYAVSAKKYPKPKNKKQRFIFQRYKRLILVR